MLDIKTRQKYLKELGFYNGNIDGITGALTKQAYKKLQDAYFIRTKDKDSVYGNNTDILLQSAYNVKDIKNFKLSEFRCKCGGKYCTGYPAIVDKNLAINLQTMRDKYGSIVITCGLRCNTYNKQVGGVTNSSHKQGKACDIYIKNKSDSHIGRVELVNYWNTLFNSKYAYCNGYMKYVGKNSTVYNSKAMGNAVHVNVK